eukprot:195957-Hanusia_phi.AAC.2
MERRKKIRIEEMTDDGECKEEGKEEEEELDNHHHDVGMESGDAKYSKVQKLLTVTLKVGRERNCLSSVLMDEKRTAIRQAMISTCPRCSHGRKKKLNGRLKGRRGERIRDCFVEL